jgi:hypothetical protein
MRSAFRAAALLAGVALAGCREQSPAAPSLEATCSASPSSGPSPLVARFVVNVAGAQGPLSIAINYGDGAAGTDVTAAHTYAAVGTYSVAFTVTTPSQSALCSTAVRVDAAAATPSPTFPPSGPNQAPQAVFRTVPAAPSDGVFIATGSIAIEFNMCPTADPEKDPLQFTMDFEGDGTTEVAGRTGGDCRRGHTYSIGEQHPRICVTDLSSGLSPLHAFQCHTYTVRVNR